jgi:REP element-mobilizing transposase RayT
MPSPRLLRGRASERHAIYSVTTVVAGRRTPFAERSAAALLADELRLAESEDLATNLAWIVMPDHLHWLFALRADSLARVMQRVKSRSARRVDSLLGWASPLWQPGYYDHRLRADDDLLKQARYLLLNPVRAGLVQRIDDWHASWCRWPVAHEDL